MFWGSLFPCHISQPKIRYTVLNWGLCLLLGPLVEISFWSSILMLWRWIYFILGSAFWKVEAAYFFPSADLTISWQHHPQQPVLLQFADALLIYQNHRFLQLSQAPATRTSCTSRVRTWDRTPAPRRPRAVSADANGGGCSSCGLPRYIYATLQLHWGPSRYSCHVFCSLWRIPVSKPHCHHTTSLATLPRRWRSGDTNTSVQPTFSYDKDGLTLKTQVARAAEPRWPLLSIAARGAT